MKYFTDGSSTIGVKSAHVVTDETGKVLAFEELKAPNELSNNQEEYRGVITALKKRPR
jgi:ribonuclease HI